MATFAYRAMDTGGKLVRGTLEAGSVGELEGRLKRLGLDLVHGEAARGDPSRRARRAPKRELITFCFQLEQLTRAGVPIVETLADLRDGGASAHFRSIAADLVERIEGGATLSEAMAGHPQTFDGVFTSLVRAGEQSGRLPDVLTALADTLRREDELASWGRRIVIYPLIVLAVILAALVVALVWVVPELARLFASTGQALPLQTRLLVGASDFVVAYGAWLVAGLVLAAAGLRLAIASRPAARRRLDALKLSLPVVGRIRRRIVLARFTGLFALLYASGIPIIEALKISEGVVGNLAMQAGLRRAGARIAEGSSLSEAFESVSLFPTLIVRMLRVGEATGALDSALANVGYFYDRDVRESVLRLQAMMEPALTVVLGVLLLWVMSAVLSPLYDLVTRMKA